ncbi:hypothetical protein LTR97_007537 [Elasticomyces elasticus]|uniref:Uncharacterized protein n=1 Tax=Elasticomyces elasticus TaxID=574655 RepID=A0AAN7W8F9_9PEZI|nr:hypothetical protein LTR97_007537 [Elasticomyces elasticus]KAK5715525.1 hypothetical protein LTR15_010170 [Elasticomyces elasticus]
MARARSRAGVLTPQEKHGDSDGRRRDVVTKSPSNGTFPRFDSSIPVFCQEPFSLPSTTSVAAGITKRHHCCVEASGNEISAISHARQKHSKRALRKRRSQSTLMGICSSCLGVRHPSRDVNETDALLDNSRPVQYGSLDVDDSPSPDEEELQRGREALERITNEATEYAESRKWRLTVASNMIDVSHSSSTDLSQHLAHTNHDRQPVPENDNAASSTKLAQTTTEDDEAMWLQSVQASPATLTQVKGLHSGTLTLDIGRLRNESPSSTKLATQTG